MKIVKGTRQMHPSKFAYKWVRVKGVVVPELQSNQGVEIRAEYKHGLQPAKEFLLSHVDKAGILFRSGKNHIRWTNTGYLFPKDIRDWAWETKNREAAMRLVGVLKEIRGVRVTLMLWTKVRK